MSARYLLELVATIAYLDYELREALKANANDWEGRGVRFVTTLWRGRYASSDPKVADMLQTFGVSKKAVKPIGIEGAVRQLSTRPELKTVVQDYNFLSNMCHHNGSGHQLYHRSMRVTDQIMLPWGDRSVFTKPGPRGHAVLSANERYSSFVGTDRICSASLLRLVGNDLARTTDHAVLGR